MADVTFSFVTALAEHGRTDCYCEYNVRKGKGYLMAEGPLTPDAIAAHQRGEQPIAIYLFNGDTTRLAALDIDNHGSELDWQGVAARSLPLVEDLRSRGLTPFVARSGGGAGIHIWLVWREPQNCRQVRRLLARIPADDIDRAAAEIIASYTDPEEEAFARHEAAWYRSEGAEQVYWYRVRKAVRRRLRQGLP